MFWHGPSTKKKRARNVGLEIGKGNYRGGTNSGIKDSRDTMIGRDQERGGDSKKRGKRPTRPASGKGGDGFAGVSVRRH